MRVETRDNRAVRVRLETVDYDLLDVHGWMLRGDENGGH